METKEKSRHAGSGRLVSAPPQCFDKSVRLVPEDAGIKAEAETSEPTT